MLVPRGHTTRPVISASHLSHHWLFWNRSGPVLRLISSARPPSRQVLQLREQPALGGVLEVSQGRQLGFDLAVVKLLIWSRKAA